jgi:hypothetical protein
MEKASEQHSQLIQMLESAVAVRFTLEAISWRALQTAQFLRESINSGEAALADWTPRLTLKSKSH